MAVVFTEVPSYYSSVFGPLVYKMANIKQGEKSHVEIYTVSQQDPIGVKRIAPGSSGEVNISAYMRRCISPSPFPVDSVGLFQDAGRYVMTGITCQGVMSPIRTYVGAVRKMDEFEMLSVLPAARTIAWDESDEISFVVPNSSLTYSVGLYGTKNYVFESPEYIASRGVVTMAIGMPGIESLVRSAGMKRDDFTKMTVRVMNVGNEIGRADYYIRSRGSDCMRLGWFNTLGGVDYHTFGSVLSDSVSVSKDIFLGYGGYSAASIGCEFLRELSSGYLPYIWVEGLSGLLTSPRVWRMDESDYVQVDVLSTGNVLYGGKLNSLEFLIRDRIPVTCQNF